MVREEIGSLFATREKIVTKDNNSHPHMVVWKGGVPSHYLGLLDDNE